MKKIQVDANAQSLDTVLEFVKAQLKSIGASDRDLKKMHMVIDEIFTNISNYAYKDSGTVEVITDYEQESCIFSLIFQDDGEPFDPLSVKGPDTSLSAKERGLGGLGIMMVKNTMDEIFYENRDGKNVLTLKKRIGGEHA